MAVELSDDRRQRLDEEYVKVACRPQHAGDPAQLVDQAGALLPVDDGAEHADGGTQAAQGDAHLVHALRVVAEQHHVVVSLQLAEALPADVAESFVRTQVAFQYHRLCPGDRRWCRSIVGVAALGFADIFYVQRDACLQLQRQLEQAPRMPVLEFQFDFVNRFGLVLHLQFAPVQRHFDVAAVRHRQLPFGALHLGNENRRQRGAQGIVVENPGQRRIGDLAEIGMAGGDCALPFHALVQSGQRLAARLSRPGTSRPTCAARAG